MPKVKLLSSVKKFDDGFLHITYDRAVDPSSGRESGRLVVHHPGSAVILPVNANGDVLLERIFRLAVRDYVWELPAGRLDPGETPLQAAKRELREETGLRARRWKKIAEFYASPGFLAESMTMYRAEDLQEGDHERGADEPMKLRWFTRRELERWLDSGRFRDAKTIIGLRAWLQESGTSHATRPRGGSR